MEETLELSIVSSKRELSEATSLSDRAYHELEQLIVTMRLLPGSPISEAQLIEKLGIGRTLIR